MGLTQNRCGTNPWILAQADRSAVTRNYRLMAGVAEEQRYVHNDKTKSIMSEYNKVRYCMFTFRNKVLLYVYI